jgi:ABC-type proline/glycine betaine transport system permease subunit
MWGNNVSKGQQTQQQKPSNIDTLIGQQTQLLGDLIFSGLAMVDAGLMLAGAVPTACLAIILNWSFERLENLVISPGIPRGE